MMSRGEVMKTFAREDFDVTAIMAAAFRETNDEGEGAA